MHFQRAILGFSTLALAGVGVGLVACSSSGSTSAPSYTSTAAAVAGAADTHCGTKTITVSQAACKAAPDDQEHADADTDAGDTDTDGGADMGDMGGDDYGPTLFNSEGDDDDCKYHLKWTSDTVAQNADVHFQVVITTKADGKPVTGGPVSTEITLDKTHPVPNSGVTTTETSPGTYVIGPIHFDAAGKWTLRFHIHEDCNDGETSPHGHGAFFVQVP